MSLKFKSIIRPGLVLVLVSLMLLGCGRKGPLTLPDAQAQLALHPTQETS